MIAWLKRRRYRRAMLRMIDQARTCAFTNRKCNRTSGLRAIRDFERVNDVAFDPFNSLHRSQVSGMGKYIELTRTFALWRKRNSALWRERQEIT